MRKMKTIWEGKGHDRKNVAEKVGDQKASAGLIETNGSRITAAEVEWMYDLLGLMIRYHPDQRSPVEVIARHRWFITADRPLSTLGKG